MKVCSQGHGGKRLKNIENKNYYKYDTLPNVPHTVVSKAVLYNQNTLLYTFF